MTTKSRSYYEILMREDLNFSVWCINGYRCEQNSGVLLPCLYEIYTLVTLLYAKFIINRCVHVTTTWLILKAIIKPTPISGFIPTHALQFRFMRSSGPGGQSVNTSNTKVEVRFSLDEADWIPLWIKVSILGREHILLYMYSS